MSLLPRRSVLLRLLAGALSAAASHAALAAGPLRGAGATLPAPVYAAWAESYQRASGQAVAYDPVGSGAGIELAGQHQVDFGATDVPLPPERLAETGLRQFPTLIGAVVPVVNIAGIAPGKLALDAATLSAIYRGAIVNWRDPAIAALNPGLALPDARITVVHRADASGTTWLWSRWLAQNDAAWQARVGSGTTLAWPVGVEGVGNEGVASLVQRTRAAIGYVAFNYARARGLSDIALPTHDGPVVRADRASFEAAVAAAHWRSAADLSQSLLDQPGPRSWPIVGASYVLLPLGDRPAAGPFFAWALAHGSGIVDALDYVALPADAVAIVHRILPP